MPCVFMRKNLVRPGSPERTADAEPREHEQVQSNWSDS